MTDAMYDAKAACIETMVVGEILITVGEVDDKPLCHATVGWLGERLHEVSERLSKAHDAIDREAWQGGRGPAS